MSNGIPSTQTHTQHALHTDLIISVLWFRVKQATFWQCCSQYQTLGIVTGMLLLLLLPNTPTILPIVWRLSHIWLLMAEGFGRCVYAYIFWQYACDYLHKTNHICYRNFVRPCDNIDPCHQKNQNTICVIEFYFSFRMLENFL